MTEALNLSPVENRLLDELQQAFPLCERPWKAVGDRIGLGEGDVLATLADLKEAKGIVRRIGAVFEGRRLGYEGALVAVQVCPERIGGAASIIGTHPGVSHNYEREAEFNLWYTVAVPPEASLETTVDRLANLAAVEKSRILPELARYKIGVKLPTGDSRPGDREDPAPSIRQETESIPRLSEVEIKCVRALQEDLPLVPCPFKPLAEDVGITEEELLRRIEVFRERGQLRRMAVIVRHRNAGYVANAMGVWRVPEDAADGAGKIMASFRRVSHCYRRPTFDDWPYQLYTMIHGRSRDECEEIAAMMARETGVNDYRLLYSGREFKKSRVRYFVPAFNEWAERFLGPRQEEVPGKPAEFANLQGMASALAKIRSREEAATIVKALQDSGRTVVFANGCFDVLHAGHVRFLEGARALGDVLIVGINTDSSVRALKGAGRPLLPEGERAALVASLRSVDHLVLFHETTADSLLGELQPDIHAKGTDYTEETVPERETVLAYGGRVAIVGDPKDHSTRGLIQGLRNPPMSGDGS